MLFSYYTTQYGRTPLYEASRHGHTKAVQALLGADNVNLELYTKVGEFMSSHMLVLVGALYNL